jgi:Nif-specific regulatory protein
MAIRVQVAGVRPDDTPKWELLRLRRERDLYLRLLGLSEQEDLEPFLRDALELIVEVTGAARGLLEVYDRHDGEGGRRWSMVHGLSEGQVESVRQAMSQGIIARALATGTTIVTASAADDPRFRDRESVQLSRIDAVVCAPIGGFPPLGVLYLQGRVVPGPFSEDDRDAAEVFARQVAPLADRLLALRRQRDDADPTRGLRSQLRASGVVGRSAALARVLREAALVAPLDVTVLLTGESGTGKSLFARVIHENSARRSGAFVELNCAAVPETLLESELFGALPGAHSTATRRVEGKVASAERGTLLLDEVAELPLAAQAKLLQLLQSRTYYPLGSARPVVADVRVIAASNADLQAAVAARRFRDDLYYRLQVMPIRIPALAERRDDVPELADYFCARAVERHRLPEVRLSPGARRALQAAEWPGHVRQLEHAVEVAAIRAAGEGAVQIEAAHVFPNANGAAEVPPRTFQDATRRYQAKLVRETLEDSNWNVVDAARRLDIARSHLYNLIHAFGIERSRR